MTNEPITVDLNSEPGRNDYRIIFDTNNNGVDLADFQYKRETTLSLTHEPEINRTIVTFRDVGVHVELPVVPFIGKIDAPASSKNLDFEKFMEMAKTHAIIWSLVKGNLNHVVNHQTMHVNPIVTKEIYRGSR